jgi:hypothetical protein
MNKTHATPIKAPTTLVFSAELVQFRARLIRPSFSYTLGSTAPCVQLQGVVRRAECKEILIPQISLRDEGQNLLSSTLAAMSCGAPMTVT